MYSKAVPKGCNLARFPAPHDLRRRVGRRRGVVVARVLCMRSNWRDGVGRGTEACLRVHRWGRATEPGASRVLMSRVEEIMTCQFH